VKTGLLVVVGLLALWIPATAADLSGQWSLVLTPDFSGNNDTLACSFAQSGDKLTINCGAGPNITGTTQGQRVTFRVPTGRSEELMAVFVGILDQGAVAISGTWQLDDKDRKREGKFAAAKVSSPK
jgi:hypothetical protein